MKQICLAAILLLTLVAAKKPAGDEYDYNYIGQRVNAQCDRVVGEYVPGAIVAFLNADSVAFLRAYGIADLETDADLRTDQTMDVGTLAEPLNDVVPSQKADSIQLPSQYNVQQIVQWCRKFLSMDAEARAAVENYGLFLEQDGSRSFMSDTGCYIRLRTHKNTAVIVLTNVQLANNDYNVKPFCHNIYYAFKN